jgi:hypothetical protein
MPVLMRRQHLPTIAATRGANIPAVRVNLIMRIHYGVITSGSIWVIFDAF